jgi:dihydrodipicolinate synthase/N-acetylneuraminate lyase
MNFAGVLAPIPTPFDEHDRVDTARLKAALQKWMATSLDGVVVLVEWKWPDGRLRSDQVDCRGLRGAPPPRRSTSTGRESTQAAIRASKRAAEHGADAVPVRTPGSSRRR